MPNKLNEEQEVYLPGVISETQKTEDGATRIKITDLEVWVNKRFLCEVKQWN